jgi:hypothetical protein
MKRSSASSSFFLNKLCVQITRPRPGRRGAEAAELRALIPALPSRRAARVDSFERSSQESGLIPKPQKEWASRRVSGVSGVFSCRAMCVGVHPRSRFGSRAQLQCRSAVSVGSATVFPRGRGNGRRREARQGAIRIFSETPFPPQRPATYHSDFTRCAIPRTVPSRETPRTPRPFAGPGFARSRIGASWGSAPVRLRLAVGAGVGTRMAG